MLKKNCAGIPPKNLTGPGPPSSLSKKCPEKRASNSVLGWPDSTPLCPEGGKGYLSPTVTSKPPSKTVSCCFPGVFPLGIPGTGPASPSAPTDRFSYYPIKILGKNPLFGNPPSGNFKNSPANSKTPPTPCIRDSSPPLWAIPLTTGLTKSTSPKNTFSSAMTPFCPSTSGSIQKKFFRPSQGSISAPGRALKKICSIKKKRLQEAQKDLDIVFLPHHPWEEMTSRGQRDDA